ncbi:MAG: hypothetical protein DWQ07_19055 [Chloroflexi bacterium]|nr:MAG: hypothetical protein DWQ07_19055 [Chloroflexota bacterium]MBL1195032.1 hypothetical protein [Chloroflexota bacterium]NOH12321.1 hypothetical protein [Chloroflexota bacterium]
MPVLTRWFIKASFLYLVLAFLLGLWLPAASLWGLSSAGVSPVFFHFFLVGWVTQIIFGVAYWMLPKYTRENPRRNETLAWAVFWMLNLGLVLRGILEPIISSGSSAIIGWLLVLSAFLQWLGGMGFVFNTWGRVKER